MRRWPRRWPSSANGSPRCSRRKTKRKACGRSSRNARPDGKAHELRSLARAAVDPERSEEHTSELQSRRDLVCRLLLEKKKKKKKIALIKYKKKRKQKGI